MATEECDAFESCVQIFLKKQIKRLEKVHGRDCLPSHHAKLCQEARRITKHSTHVLKTLYTKRRSLSHAIDAFDFISRECIKIAKFMMVNHNANVDMNSLGTNDEHRKRKRQRDAMNDNHGKLQDLLTHIFLQYIHIRDGFVLLTSGECRHRGDAKLLSSSSHVFKSQLNRARKNARKDGYTSLFSSKCGYSGYGWDEFHNEEVGIRRRLLDTLRECCSCRPRAKTDENDDAAARTREKVWDKLIEMGGGQLFESAFDTHENEMKELQKRLEDTRARFMSGMERALSASVLSIGATEGKASGAVRLIMVTEDKFERLELKNASVIGLAAICIQRQGDAFKGKGNGRGNVATDQGGALPSGATREDWIKLMQIPSHLTGLVATASMPKNKGEDGGSGSSSKTSTSTSDATSKKKRLTIADSDDGDSDSEDEIIPNSGLKVTVKQAVASKERNSSSLANIKEQFGVNVDELQRAREDVEDEEKGTKAAAFMDEIGELLPSSSMSSHTRTMQQQTHANVIRHSEAIFNINADILEQEEHVQTHKSACKRKNNKDDEAWKAREGLRLHLMSLGNLYLECHALVNTNNADYSLLTKALSCFENALSTIKELEHLNNYDQRLNTRGDPIEELAERSRSIFLCRGRANTNVGKVYFEQYEILSRKRRSLNSSTTRLSKEERVKLNSCVSHLRNAERDAGALRAHAIVDLNKSSLASDPAAEMHLVEANALESLICRFQGYAFLSLSKEIECIEAVKKASGIRNDVAVPNSISLRGGKDIIEAELGLLLEQYFGACSLVHLVDSFLNLSLRGNPSKSNSDENMSTILLQGYDRAEDISKTFETLSQNASIPVDIKRIMIEHDVTPSSEIRSAKESARRVRNERLSRAKQCGSISAAITERPRIRTPRNDLFRNSVPTPRMQSHTRMTIDDGMPYQKRSDQNGLQQKKATAPSDDSFDGFGIQTNEDNEDFSSSVFGNDDQIRNIKYRKWGDELIENPNQYPACEPKKPPQMIQELGLAE